MNGVAGHSARDCEASEQDVELLAYRRVTSRKSILFPVVSSIRVRFHMGNEENTPAIHKLGFAVRDEVPPPSDFLEVLLDARVQNLAHKHLSFGQVIVSHFVTPWCGVLVKGS
jgi:hypothetical protein